MQPCILTVLRSGGEYEVEHVERLRLQCRQYAPKTPFLAVSDAHLPKMARLPLKHGWPGWWSKIEAFRVEGPVLYMDLDTTIVGDLAPLLEAVTEHEFIALRDFNPKSRDMGSGLMGWSGDMQRIYRAFLEAPDEHMARCTTPRHWGDQGFIEPLTDGRVYWQDILPGAVVSWKKHCQSGVPDGARVICFHGRPRPWQLG